MVIRRNFLKDWRGLAKMDKLEEWIMKHAKTTSAEETCQEHIRQYICQECKDTGWITFYKDGHEFMRRCRCYAVKRTEELMEKSGLPAELCKKGFRGFDTRGNPSLENAKNKAVGYVQDFMKIRHGRYNSIMFCGQPGSGKTHLGTAICSSLAREGIPVIYMPYRNSMTKIKQNIASETEYSRETRRYMEASVLYIDDMLKGKLTETDVNVMYEIINYRYMNNLPLIISTEKDLEGLLVFDEATGSRVIEMCRGNIAFLEGRGLNYRMFMQGVV